MTLRLEYTVSGFLPSMGYTIALESRPARQPTDRDTPRHPHLAAACRTGFAVAHIHDDGRDTWMVFCTVDAFPARP